jgi:hypothetical protein
LLLSIVSLLEAAAAAATATGVMVVNTDIAVALLAQLPYPATEEWVAAFRGDIV